MLCEIAAFAVAGLVMRGPFDEGFSFLMAPTIGRDCGGAEMRGLASAQPCQPYLARRDHEHNEIEMHDEPLGPAGDRSAQHPIAARCGSARRSASARPSVVTPEPDAPIR